MEEETQLGETSEHESEREAGERSSLSAGAKSWAIAFLILVASCLLGLKILNSGPTQEKVTAPAAVSSVEVAPLEATRYPITIRAFGSVIPARQVTLSPEVEGRIVKVHPDMELGALVSEGDVLLQLDRAEYRVDLDRARAEHDVAKAEMAIELGRQRVAAREWEVFKKQQNAEGADVSNTSLALRKPQLAQAEARIAQAKSQADRARLLLSRTTLRVPFDAVVSEESIEVGRRVGPSSEVATLTGVEKFWATVTLPLDQAALLDELHVGAPVQIALATGLGEHTMRDAHFVRRLPAVSEGGKMARALIEIPDPLAIKQSAPVIPLGSYVRADISAGAIEGVYEVSRQALRENQQVWVRDADGVLRFRAIEVVWRNEESVLVRAEFEPGDALITSYLDSPLPGTEVRIRGGQ